MEQNLVNDNKSEYTMEENCVISQLEKKLVQVNNEKTILAKKLQKMAENYNKLSILLSSKEKERLVFQETRTLGTLSNLVSTNSIYDISHIQKKGRIFVLAGKMPVDRDWMHINFEITGNDKPLHMSVRQNDKVTVFNNMKNKVWCSPEEREHWFPFKRGHIYTFTFHVQTNGTTVSVNDEFLHYFKHRMDMEQVVRISCDLERELDNHLVIDSFDTECDRLMLPAPYVLTTEEKSNKNVPRDESQAKTMKATMPAMINKVEDELEDTFVMIDESDSEECTTDVTMDVTEKMPKSDELLQAASKMTQVHNHFQQLSLDVPPLMEHKLPKPKRHFQLYTTELDSGFQRPSMITLKTVVESGCYIKLKEVGLTHSNEIEFRFEPQHNQIVMTEHAGFYIAHQSEKIKLIVGDVSTILIWRKDKGFQVFVNGSYVNFFEDRRISFQFNTLEISGRFLSDITYFTEKSNKTQISSNELTCLQRRCDLRGMVKMVGKVFTLTGKMPMNRNWMHINFDISDKDTALHMSVRQNERVVVFNNKKNNEWCTPEERVYRFPFERGQTYTFTFRMQPFGTDILVNGDTYYFFKHRMDPEKITRLRCDLEDEHDYSYTVGESGGQMLPNPKK